MKRQSKEQESNADMFVSEDILSQSLLLVVVIRNMSTFDLNSFESKSMNIPFSSSRSLDCSLNRSIITSRFENPDKIGKYRDHDGHIESSL